MAIQSINPCCCIAMMDLVKEPMIPCRKRPRLRSRRRRTAAGSRIVDSLHDDCATFCWPAKCSMRCSFTPARDLMKVSVFPWSGPLGSQPDTMFCDCRVRAILGGWFGCANPEPLSSSGGSGCFVSCQGGSRFGVGRREENRPRDRGQRSRLERPAPANAQSWPCPLARCKPTSALVGEHARLCREQ